MVAAADTREAMGAQPIGDGSDSVSNVAPGGKENALGTALGLRIEKGGGEPERRIAGALRDANASNAPEKASAKNHVPTTWEEEVEHYVKAHPTGSADRDAKVAAVQVDPQDPDAWLAFLAGEDRSLSKATSEAARMQHFGLLRLYGWATRTVPKKAKPFPTLQVWLGYAKLQAIRNEEDARDTFKSLKRQPFAEASPRLYAEWAAFELSKGYPDKAAKLVQKGMELGGDNPPPELAELSARLEARVGPGGRRGSAAGSHPGTPTSHTHHSSSSGSSGGSETPSLHGFRPPATPQGGAQATPAAVRATPAARPARASDSSGAELSLGAGALAGGGHMTPARAAPGVAAAGHATPATGKSHVASCSGAAGAGGDEETVSLFRTRAAAHSAVKRPASALKKGQGPKRLGLSGLLGGPARRVNPGEKGPDGAAESAPTMMPPSQAPAPTPAPAAAPPPAAMSPDATVPLAVARAPIAAKAAAPIAVPAPRAEAPAEVTPPRAAARAARARAPAGGREDKENLPARPARAAAAAAAATSSSSAAAPADGTTPPRLTAAARAAAAPARAGKADDAATPPRPTAAPKAADDVVTPPRASSAARPARAAQDSAATPPRAAAAAAPVAAARPRAAAAAAAEDAATPPRAAAPPAAAKPRQAAKAEDAPTPPRAAAAPAAANKVAAAKDAPTPPRAARPAAAAVAKAAPRASSAAPRAAVDPEAPTPARASSTTAAPAARPTSARPTSAAAAARPQSSRSSSAAASSTAAPAASSQRRPREDDNTVVVNNTRYAKLECVGRGGSSKVYKVMHPSRKIYAMKRIRLGKHDLETAAGFLDEIKLLARLKGRHNIIQLVESEVIRVEGGEGIIYVVLEYGEIDLNRLLARREKARQVAGTAQGVDHNFLRLYFEQMLEAVQAIHEERIVHSDLKPANFLFVEGTLKLIDFGIAKAMGNDTTGIMRESQVGTLNYMSPEAILGGNNQVDATGQPIKVGRASDVWSLGCILYQIVYGRTPFSHLQFIPKLHAITDPNHRIAFEPVGDDALMEMMRRCLDRNPRTRITIPELLQSAYLRSSAPSPAPAPAAPAAPAMTPEVLQSIMVQLAQVGGAGVDAAKVSQEVFRQLAAGQQVDISAIVRAQQAQHAKQGAEAGAGGGAKAASAKAGPPVAAAAAAAQPTGAMEGAGSGGVAAAAARAAAQRAADPARSAAAVAAADGAAAAHRAGESEFQAALKQQQQKLRPAPAARPAPPPAGGLEGALRSGLAKMATSMQGGGDAGGDDTSSWH